MPCEEAPGWWGIMGVVALVVGWLLSLFTQWMLLRMKNHGRKAS